MGWCLESLYTKMSVSLQDHTDLVGIVPQMSVTITMRVLRITTIFLVVNYYNFEG